MSYNNKQKWEKNVMKGEKLDCQFSRTIIMWEERRIICKLPSKEYFV